MGDFRLFFFDFISVPIFDDSDDAISLTSLISGEEVARLLFSLRDEMTIAKTINPIEDDTIIGLIRAMPFNEIRGASTSYQILL